MNEVSNSAKYVKILLVLQKAASFDCSRLKIGQSEAVIFSVPTNESHM